MLSEIQVSAAALKHNFQQFQTYLGPNKKIIAVVKANAYGLGLREVVEVLDGENEVEAFAIDDIEELFAVRFYTDKPIYVLGYVPPEDIDRLIDLRGIPVVYSEEMVRYISERASVVKQEVEINVKLDALLGRQGVLLDELPSLLRVIQESPHVSLRGIYAHFANIEDTTDFSHAQKQIDVYTKGVEMVREAGFQSVETHISSTAGCLVFEKGSDLCSHVRIGLGLYGLWPSRELKATHEDSMPLELAVRWVTHIAQVKTLPSEYPIGYGLTYITKAETRVAVIPQGYSDGYDRYLSNKGEVLIHGMRCPIVGRVAMNMFVVDVSRVGEVVVGDEVVLIGSQGTDCIRPHEIAEHIDSINYEVISQINPLLPRVVVENVADEV